MANSTCDQCKAGFFSFDMSPAPCSACPIGYVAPYPGLAACDLCEAGKYRLSATYCEHCPLEGVDCKMGDGLLHPLDGWWTPAAILEEHPACWDLQRRESTK